MIHYSLLSRQEYKVGSFIYVSLREQDVESIRLWRNAQRDVLRQKKPLTQEEQNTYYKTQIAPDFGSPRPSQILFSILSEGLCVGYGGLTYIDWDIGRAEVSFLLDPESGHYAEAFSAFLTHLKQVAFSELKLHRLFTETYAFRKEHCKVLESQGFFLEGRLRDHVKIQGHWVDSLIHGCINE